MDDDELEFEYGEPGMPPPDWERYQVRSRAVDTTGHSHTPLGDPTRWGGTTEVAVSGLIILQRHESPQFMRAQVALPSYPRLWAVTGTVQAPSSCWALPATDWTIALRISQGAGQGTVIQQFDLRKLTDIAIASAYLAQAGQGATDTFEIRPFAIIGGVLGLQWSAAVVQTMIGLPPTGDPIITTAIATPLAAGTGL